MELQSIDLTTADHTSISMFSLVPASITKPAVLLIHGIGATNKMWHSRVQNFPLPEVLAARGYPVFSLNLRHRHGRVPAEWNMDDYVDFDLPAAIHSLQQRTASPYFHIIGHSMGGILALMYQVMHEAPHLLSVTTLGSPGLRAKPRQAKFIQCARPFIGAAGLLTDLARLNEVPSMLLSTLLMVESVVANPRDLKLKVGQWSHPGVNEYCGNVSRPEVDQLTSMFMPGGIRSIRHGLSYGQHLPKVIAPHLAIASDRDVVSPPGLVVQGFHDISPRKKYYVNVSRAGGYSSSYGHHDLLMSNRAHLDIWPIITRWLGENSEGARF